MKKLDLSLEICPIALVKCKLFVEEMTSGEGVEIIPSIELESYNNISNYLNNKKEFKIDKKLDKLLVYKN